MARLLAVAIALVVAAATASLTTLVLAQAPSCLHGQDETSEQRARRSEAVNFIRAVNTAENRLSSVGDYLGLDRLADVPTSQLPSGFAAQLTVNGSHYSVWLKDSTDPCRMALVSDESGVIYRGEPIGVRR